MKILLHSSVFGPDTFADHYIFNCHETTPLHTIIYIGGGISVEEYRKRRETEPVEIRELLQHISEDIKKPLQAVILSSPPSAMEHHEEVGEMIQVHFHKELMPAVGIPGWEFSLVGNSYGAFLSVRIAVSLGDSLCGVACLGGVGMSEALNMGIPKGRELMKKSSGIYCFSNLDDPYYSHTAMIEQKCIDLDIACKVTRKIGDHSFEDYHMNGSLEEALRFAADGYHRPCSST